MEGLSILPEAPSFSLGEGLVTPPLQLSPTPNFAPTLLRAEGHPQSRARSGSWGAGGGSGEGWVGWEVGSASSTLVPSGPQQGGGGDPRGSST